MLGLLIAAGAVAHGVGGVLALRGSAASARWASLGGATLAAASAVAALAQGAGAPDVRLGAMWGLSAAMLMCVAHGFRERAVSAWPSLALSGIALGAALAAAMLLQLAPRPAIETVPLVASAWTAAHATCAAGGAGFLVLGLLVATQDERLRHASWLGLGLALATLALSALTASATGPESLVGFALSDARGVAVEIRADVLRSADQAEPVAIGAFATSALLTRLLVIVAGLCAAAGLVGSLRRGAGRLLFALAAAAALLAAVLCVGASGAVATPGLEALLEQLAAAGVAPELLAAPPALGPHQGALSIHLSQVVPLAMVLWSVAVLCAVRAAAAAAPAPAGGARSFTVGAPLATARDAVLLGALLLWISLALGMLATLATLERFVADHRVTAQAALAVLAVALVTSWHSALARSSRAALALWTALLALLVAVCALVWVSGAFTGESWALLSPALLR